MSKASGAEHVTSNEDTRYSEEYQRYVDVVTRKPVVDREIKEQQVVQNELETIKKGAKVYKQQPNSLVFFREDKDVALKEAKKNLGNLVKEYREIEKMEK